MEKLKICWLVVFILLIIRSLSALSALVVLFVCGDAVASNRALTTDIVFVVGELAINMGAFGNLTILVILVIGIISNALIDRMDFVLESICILMSLSFPFELLGGLLILGLGGYYQGSGDESYLASKSFDKTPTWESLAPTYRCCGLKGPKGMKHIPATCCPDGISCSASKAYQAACQDVASVGTTCIFQIGVVMVFFSFLTFAASIVIAVYMKRRDEQSE